MRRGRRGGVIGEAGAGRRDGSVRGGSGRQRIDFSRGAPNESRGWPRGTGRAGLETREGLFGKCAHLRRGRPRRSCRTTPRLRLRGLGDGSVGGECRAVEGTTPTFRQRLKIQRCAGREWSGAHLLRQCKRLCKRAGVSNAALRRAVTGGVCAPGCDCQGPRSLDRPSKAFEYRDRYFFHVRSDVPAGANPAAGFAAKKIRKLVLTRLLV